MYRCVTELKGLIIDIDSFKDIDISTCKIDNIKVDICNLKGCKINSVQGINILKNMDIEII